MKDCVVTFLYSDLTTDEGELQRRIETIIDIIDFRDDLLE